MTTTVSLSPAMQTPGLSGTARSRSAVGIPPRNRAPFSVRISKNEQFETNYAG
jgi:hypothetical protein